MAQSLIDIIIKATDKASGEIDKVKKSLEGMNESQAESVSLSEAFSGVMGGFGTGIAASFGVAAAAAMVFKQAFDLGEQGAAVMRLADNSALVAKSMGSDMDDIVAAVRSASLNTVSDYDIMAGASRAMMLGVSADAGQLANLMEVAALRGRAMGVSTTQAFNDIVTGIGRMSPLILDNLGIVVNSEAAFSAYAESIGKTKDELTGAEKKQALLNEVLAEGNNLLDAAGGLAKDAASEYEEFGANMKNMFDNMKVGIAEVLTPTIKAINELTGSQNALDQAVRDGLISSDEANAITMALKGGMTDYSEILDIVALRTLNLTNEEDALWRKLEGETTPAIDESTEATEDLAISEEELAKQTEIARKEQEELAAAMRAARDAAREQIDAITDLAEALGDWDAAAQYRNIKAAAQEWYDAGKIGETQYQQLLKDSGIALEQFTEEQWNEAEALEWLQDSYVTLGGNMSDYSAAQNLVRDVVSDASWTVGELGDALNNAGFAASASAEQTRLMEGVMNQLDLNPAIEETGELAGNLGYIEGVQGKKIDYTVTTTYITVGSPSPYMGNVPGWGGGGVSDWSNVVERAAGGPLFAGQPSIVGELGPEIFIPNTNGTIIPNNQLGGNVTMYNTFTVPNEATARAVAKELARELNRQGVTA